MKETKDSTNKWEDTYAHGLEELILLIWLYYSRQSTDLV